MRLCLRDRCNAVLDKSWTIDAEEFSSSWPRQVTPESWERSTHFAHVSRIRCYTLDGNRYRLWNRIRIMHTKLSIVWLCSVLLSVVRQTAVVICVIATICLMPILEQSSQIDLLQLHRPSDRVGRRTCHRPTGNASDPDPKPYAWASMPLCMLRRPALASRRPESLSSAIDGPCRRGIWRVLGRETN